MQIRFSLLALAFLFSSVSAWTQTSGDNAPNTPHCVHVPYGSVYKISDSMTISHITRHQHYNPTEKKTYDADIYSPKSVNISPDGTKYYINSLEGYKTVVYDFSNHQKIACIKHSFSDKDSSLWAKPSGLYLFNYNNPKQNTFKGKPVESTFSHDGRYLWVPYYRRSFDINAQDPSALAVIDTKSDSIVRLFETGALPKMVATSPDGKWLAVTHWGENTVGLIDISSQSVDDWHYTNNFVIDYKLNLNYSRTESVDRDVNSGYCLRGTVFTPDSRYLLVGCMGGTGGIAAIDLQSRQYVGRILGMLSNLRHLIIHDSWLYLSINNSGAVQRIHLDTITSAIANMKGKTLKVDGWETCMVSKGARTISISPDGRYIFAACNSGSCIAVVDTKSFKMIGQVPVDSYPVGLDISMDGQTIFVTSQGRNSIGGNAVNIYHVDYAPATPVPSE